MFLRFSNSELSLFDIRVFCYFDMDLFLVYVLTCSDMIRFCVQWTFEFLLYGSFDICLL